MYTSVAIALVSLYAPGLDQGPAWSGDYFQARKQGRASGKPLAVFVGQGFGGFEKLSEGKWSPAIRQALTQKYVCVYLDTTTKRGRELADALAISQDVGVVLSDRGGELQAFHHDGTLAERELVRRLEQFADPDVVVQQTTTNQRVSYYPPASNGQTYVPAARGRNC